MEGGDSGTLQPETGTEEGEAKSGDVELVCVHYWERERERERKEGEEHCQFTCSSLLAS